MKALISLKYIPFVIAFLIAGSHVMAQDEEGEFEMQKAMQAEEMKAMQAEELRARKEMLEVQRKESMEMERQRADQLRDMEYEMRESSRARESARSSSRARYAVPSSGVYADGHYLIGTYGQETQSQLTLRKSFRDVTSTSKGEFDVDSNIRHFRCMISGSVKSGEIFVGIEYPDGKTFKELVINSSADINFSQSVSIKEGEEKKYTGSWSYVIKADKAEGNYMVQIMTN